MDITRERKEIFSSLPVTEQSFKRSFKTSSKPNAPALECLARGTKKLFAMDITRERKEIFSSHCGGVKQNCGVYVQNYLTSLLRHVYVPEPYPQGSSRSRFSWTGRVVWATNTWAVGLARRCCRKFDLCSRSFSFSKNLCKQAGLDLVPNIAGWKTLDPRTRVSETLRETFAIFPCMTNCCGGHLDEQRLNLKSLTS